MDESLELSLESFAFLLVFASLITYFAVIKGFYSFGSAKPVNERNASFFETAIAFLLFIVPAVFVMPLFNKLLQFISPPLYPRLIAGILSIIATALILLFYSKLTLFKNKPIFSLSAFFKGALTWIIAYPQMMLLTIIMNYFTVNVLGLTPNEQSTVAELREARSYPELFSLWILTICFVVPICEELLFRGFLQTSLKKIFSRGGALVLASLIFALFHYTQTQGAGNLVILPSLFFFSLYLGFVFEKWGSISAAFGLHMIFNLMSSLMVVFS